jgi:hypothetical protein
MRKKTADPINGKRTSPKSQPQPRFKNWRTFDPTKVVGDQTLLEELTTYRDNLDKLLQRKGDYVLIKGRKVIGIFADRQEAIEKAYDLYGGQPALVKQIVAKERTHTLPGIVL